MILHRIVAANVGPFVDGPATAGPFAPGLNILSAPNETGKTTLLKAAGRALFDRHTCKADEIKNLRPAGTTLSPAITVEFQTGAGHFRIEKTFLQGPRSLLSEDQGGVWKTVAEGDGADDRLNALLQSTKPGAGATKVAHWGMLGYLWMRQGELAEWPEWHKAPAGQTVQGMLVKVELDPFIQTVRDQMWSVFTENFTPSTNQPKVGGSLLAAETDLRRVTDELAAVAQARHDLQRDQDAFDRLAADLPRLEEEHARCQRQAATLRETAAQADLLRVEVDRQRHALATARDRLNAVQHDDQTLSNHARRSAELLAKLRATKDEAAAYNSTATAAQERLRQADAIREANSQALATVLADQTRLVKHLRYQRLTKEIVQGSQTLERCQHDAPAIARLTTAGAELPTPPTAKPGAFDKLHEAILAGRARLEALGLTVELIPAAPAEIVCRPDNGPPETLPLLPAGKVRTVHAAQLLTLNLPGWGTIHLRSGAGEALSLRESLAADEESLRLELAAFGVSTPAEARLLHARIRDLEANLQTSQRTLAATLGGNSETAEALRARLVQSRRQTDILATELDLPPAELSASLAELDAAEQAASVRCENCRSEAKVLDGKVKEYREAAAQAAQRCEQAERAVLSLRLETENQRQQADALSSRYPAGIKAALEAAGENFALSTYGLKAAEEKLPSDHTTLPERNRRAAVASEQVSIALDRCRHALAELRGRLELQGSSGLHTRESALLVRQQALSVQVSQARSRSRAARLVHDLIERRQQTATRSVLAPLQERLSTRFAEISGERDRRIFLDESLTVRGLGRKDGELVNFLDLSQGAKEQLLLCLRLAIAEELVTGGGGPQSLILDDVLVNTDAARQERVLTLLNDAAHRGLQILVCTCHPDRYRGVGQVVELQKTKNAR